jgi:hypothetical protein
MLCLHGASTSSLPRCGARPWLAKLPRDFLPGAASIWVNATGSSRQLRGLRRAGVLSPPPRCLTASSVRPVMTTRAEHLRELARPCVLKAAGAKDLAMKASSSQEQKQLLMLAEQAEKEEQNRMELPPRGLTKK